VLHSLLLHLQQHYRHHDIDLSHYDIDLSRNDIDLSHYNIDLSYHDIYYDILVALNWHRHVMKC